MPKPTVKLATPWTQWKAHPMGACRLAAEVAGLGAGTLFMFFFLLIQKPRLLFWLGGGAFLLLWLFFVGVSASAAYRQRRPKAPMITPPDVTAEPEVD